MKKGRILQEIKNGKIYDSFQRQTNNLKKLVSLRKKDRDQDRLDSKAENLRSFIQQLRFVYTFLVPDYDDLARILKTVDRFAYPDDLENVTRLKDFTQKIGHLLEVHLNDNFKKRLRHFSYTEIFRLDEALFTLKNEAYLSSIVMSVSAAESRLHRIVQSELPRQYKKDKMSKATLGGLLHQIDTNKKYRRIRESLSEKFPSLLTMCNHYRIFSAHPKEEMMSYQDALAIFGLVVSFLLDPKNK